MEVDANKNYSSKGQRLTKRKKEFDEGRFFYSQPYYRNRHFNDYAYLFEANPPPLNSNTHLFFKSYAVRRDAMLADAYHLLADFLQRNSTDFLDFKGVWLNKQFHLTHFICPFRGLRDRFMFAQYQTFFTFLYEEAAAKFPGNDIQLKLKLGVIFSLYMLYLTQPKFDDPCLISVDLNQWNILIMLHHYFAAMGSTDGIYVLGKLKEMKAFSCVVYIEHRPFYYQQSRLGFDGHLPELSSEPQQKKTVNGKASRISALEVRLKDLEIAVSSNQLGDLAYIDRLKELQELEVSYEKLKDELITSEVALGLNEPISNTLMVPGFQQWLATRDGDEQLGTASLYFEHLVQSHLSFKFAHLNLIPSPEPFEDVRDIQRSDPNPAGAKPLDDEVELMLQAQKDIVFSENLSFEKNRLPDHLSEPKVFEGAATSPKSIDSLTYSIDSE